MSVDYSLTVGYGFTKAVDSSDSYWEDLDSRFPTFETLQHDIAGDYMNGEDFSVFVTVMRLSFHGEIQELDKFGVISYQGIPELTDVELKELKQAAEILIVENKPRHFVAVNVM
jgi:hypothetical protein